MDTYSNRASSLFTSFSTVLFTIASLSHLTSYFYSPQPTASIALSSGATIEYTEYKPYKADQVKFDFDLSVDLTSENNWNVNQIYLFIVATYETTKNSKNEVVIYDRILRDVSEFKFSMKKIKNKYLLRDEFRETLAGKNIELVVRYQIMPIFGLLRIKEVPIHGQFSIPQDYTSATGNKSSKKKK
jgi:signal peptidase complex subunit 3